MIVTYLIKALTEKESVFVTNLGLFSQQYQAAQIRDGQIIPPCHKVVFDPDYDGNGFAFTMFVSMKASMLTSDATVKVNQWVNELKNALDNNKSVSFENFGTFAKNDNGVITFESDRIAELNIEFEGMEAVPLSHHPIHVPVEIQEEEDTSKIRQATDNDYVAPVISETEETESAPAEEENDQTPDNEVDNTIIPEEETTEKPKKRRAWFVILIIIVVLAILNVLGYIFREEIEKFYNQQIDRNDTGEIEAQEAEDYVYETPQDTYTEVDSLAEETDIETIEGNENTTTTQQTGAATNISQTTTGNGLSNDDNFIIRFEKGKHYVIAGSFPTEADVRKHIRQQHLEKYHPKAVKQDGVSNLRVCIGIFNNEADAENFRDSVNAKYWVLN